MPGGVSGPACPFLKAAQGSRVFWAALARACVGSGWSWNSSKKNPVFWEPSVANKEEACPEVLQCPAWCLTCCGCLINVHSDLKLMSVLQTVSSLDMSANIGSAWVQVLVAQLTNCV